MNENRGSIWKKWDLHIHTPFSLVSTNYGAPSADATWENFITDLENLPPEFKVIGINDYIFIDGYKKVLEYKRSGRLANVELILPVIELRLKKFTGHERLRKINFHIIFSNEINETVLEQQFLARLYGEYQLSPLLDGYNIGWSGAITPQSLPELGASIRATVPQNRLADYAESDLVLGFNNVTFEEEKIRNILQSTYLKHKFLTAIGKTEWDSFNWHDSGIADKKSVINSVDFVFISAENISRFNAAKQRLKEDGVNHFLLDCSDAHNFSNSADKDRIGKCLTWIKADTTFEGLKQLTNKHGEYRVSIGDEPQILNRVRLNKTKYISSVFIDKKQDSSLSEIWFDDISIKLNHELIAIIGNKGNGKSALTDIIGLLGNSRNFDNFSFLKDEKFADLKDNKASNFVGKLIWESGDFDEKSLDEKPQDYAYEKVKYIPQLFLENICNQEGTFEKELKEVIFSHVPEDQRYWQENLDDLINYKTSIISENLDILYIELSNVNEIIIKLEDMGTRQNLQRIEEKLKNKQKELEAHEKSKPSEIREPQGDKEVDRQKEIAKQIAEKNAIKNTFEQKITSYNTEKTEIRNILSAIDRVSGAIANFKIQFVTLEKNIIKDLTDLGMQFSDIIKFDTDLSKLETIKEKNKSRLDYIENDLNPKGLFDKEHEQFIDNTYSRLKKILEDIELLNNQLNEPYRKYQDYQAKIKEWDKKKQEIIGDPNKEDTINFYKKELDYIIKELPVVLRRKQEERLVKSLEIYSKKKELLNIYKSLYRPVEEFISQYPLASDNYQVKFDVSLEIKNFIYEFFKYIHQGIRGSFYGLEEGKERLKAILNSTDFNNAESFKNFLSTIVKHLEYDQRDSQVEQERKDIR